MYSLIIAKEAFLHPKISLSPSLLVVFLRDGR